MVNRYTIKDRKGNYKMCSHCETESATKTHYDELKMRVIYICKYCKERIKYGTSNKIFG